MARAQYKLDIDGKVIQAGKFDHRSTEEDREAFLRSLLEDKSDEQDDNNEENEELDDEEMNLMLKRSDQEYATFAKMDLERQRINADEWKQRYGDNHPPDAKPERLMQDWELPEVYQYDQNELDRVMGAQEEDDQVLGRGQRTREHVQYDDGMTEKQWLRELEKETSGSSAQGKRGMSPDNSASLSPSNRKSKKLRMY